MFDFSITFSFLFCSFLLSCLLFCFLFYECQNMCNCWVLKQHLHFHLSDTSDMDLSFYSLPHPFSLYLLFIYLLFLPVLDLSSFLQTTTITSNTHSLQCPKHLLIYHKTITNILHFHGIASLMKERKAYGVYHFKIFLEILNYN